MTEYAFLALFTLSCLAYVRWGARTLPREQWQFAAALPIAKGADGAWQGINLTWYGLLTANAYLIAVSVLLLLLGGLAVPPSAIVALATIMLLACVPASRIVAGLVEKKAHTFTVGGAVFVGTVLAPWVITAMNRLGGDAGRQLPPLATLAAFSIAYTFGEGLGRLACLSFGCCYGKPIDACSPAMRRLFAPIALVFSGETKKIAYAGEMAGVAVVPVQLLTSLVHVAGGVAAILLFLQGAFGASFALSITVTQGWRFASELLRADYRGTGLLSAYQVMGIVAIAYSWGAMLFLPDIPARFSLAAGLAIFWSPAIIISLQIIWLSILLYTGLSRVTTAELRFSVRRDRI